MFAALLALLPLLACAAPAPGGVIHIPLNKATPPSSAGNIAQNQVTKLTNKYGFPQPLNGNAGSNVPLRDVFIDFEYDAEIQIGTPPQTLTVTIDTGSQILWAMGTECADQVCAGQDRVFDATKSSTWKYQRDGHIGYAKGGVQIKLGEESVTWGGFNVPNSQLGVATSVKNMQGMLTEKVQGLIGLARATPGTTDPSQIPWWIQASEKWQDKEFGIYLGRNSTEPLPPSPGKRDGAAPSTGQLTLGGVDKSLFEGELNYINVVDTPTNRHWNIPVEGVTVNGKVIGGGNEQIAILDSGTSMALIPTEVYNALYAAIPGSYDTTPADGGGPGFKGFPCDAVKGVKLSFKFGGKEYPIDERDLILVHTLPGQCLGGFTDISQVLTPGTLPDNSYLLGDSFMKNVYTAHKLGNPHQVGLAPIKVTN